MSDPYAYPDSDVLRNKADIRDPALAERMERVYAATRHRHAVKALRDGMLKLEMTPEGYQALHRHLFQDVYQWAGQIRTVNIAKQDLFCLAPHIETELEKRFALIRKENGLKGLPPANFAERAAEHVGELNAIHPFREGNGRVLRLFLKGLAHQAGHRLLLTRIETDVWHRASLETFRGNCRTMQSLIGNALASHKQKLSQSTKEQEQEAFGWKGRVQKHRSRSPANRGRGR